MKFTTFLKIFAISLASFIGACAIGVGILAIAGYFNTPQVMPQNLMFDQEEYNVDSDFQITISTTTTDVTVTRLTLSLQNGQVVTTQDGSVRISDGVISIPQTAEIGKPFDVYLETTKHDTECEGLDWITGGHSVITATSQNQEINSESANVNVDVPVYKVELETRVTSQDNDSDIFAVGSLVMANLKFYPARSAYQYSFDGSNGSETKYKNTYFMKTSSTDANITQQGNTNVFATNKTGTSNIVGYTFSSTPQEERVLLSFQNLDESAKYLAILARLEQLATEASTSHQAYKASKSIDIVEVEVDSMRLEGGIGNVNIDTRFSLYANNSSISQNATQSSLGIRLYSSLDETISLQHELKNVAIRFLYKVGNIYYDAVNNANKAYNVVTIPSYGYGNTKQVLVDGETFTYYFPVITTQTIDEYFWQFAVTNTVEINSLALEVKYFGETADDVEPIVVTFSTNTVNDGSIYWAEHDRTLTIIDGEIPTYNSLNVAPLAVVPNNNLYQSRAYFVIASTQFEVSDFIVTKGGVVEYQLGSQTVSLYEIADGIIQPKTTQAYGKTFDVVFMTIQTDYEGNPKHDEDYNYIFQKYSQDSLNAISTLQVYIDKTLYGLTNNLQTVLANDELIINDETNDIAYVQNTTAPFEIILGYVLPQGADQTQQTNEQLIFRNAVLNGDIYIVAQLEDSGTETSLIYSTSNSEQSDGTEFVFSMNIGALPENISERRIKLYVVYDSDVFVEPRKFEVSTYNDGQAFNCIEVYDGSAVIFNFNVNLAEDGIYQTSEQNRILVKLDIQGENGYINSIQTTYTSNGNDVSQYLFKNEEEVIDYSTLSVVLQDKYGNEPISSEYTLESSNTSILTLANGSFTFSGAGDVEVYLKDASGVIKDTLYLTSQQNGYVSQVEQLVETPNGEAVNKSDVVVYNYNTSGGSYSFPQISVPLVGYAGSTINLKSTNAGVVNLILYTYTYDGGQGLLTSLVNFSLVNEQDITSLEGYVEFGGTSQNLLSLQFLCDFGRAYSLQLRATLPQLGISQIIVLDISPNTLISVDSYGNDYSEEPISYVGNVTYLGAYADSLYNVRIQLNYIVGTGSDDFSLDSSKYSLYLYEYDAEGQLTNRTLIPNSNTLTSNAYIVSYTSSENDQVSNSDGIGRDDGQVSTYIYNASIVFKSSTENNGYKFVMLALEKNGQQNSTVDAVGSLYLYINPNIRVQQNSNEILLDVANANVNNTTYYGKGLLLSSDKNSPLSVKRIVDDSEEMQNVMFDIDYSKIDFRFVNDADRTRFYIERSGNDFIIYSLENINNSTTLNIILTYDGVDVLTSDNKSYEIQLTLRPNITRNPDSTMWVLYKGEYYLKLVNGERYSFDDILNAFTITNDGSQGITANLEIESTNNINVQAQTITIQGVNNNIIDSAFAKIYLNNSASGIGDSITFKILLLPFDVPFVIYPNAIEEEYDIYNLLDINWVVKEGLYYTLTDAGIGSTDILIEQTEEIVDGVYGIRYISGMQLTVRNLDENDHNIYAYFEGTNLITEPVGKDTFVIIEARLNLATDSLVIPYLVQIKKVLDIRVYYPYTITYSQNSNLSGTDLYSRVEDVKFDMEYLSFDENDTASVDLLENFDDVIPNSVNGSRRVVIGRLNDGEFVEQDNLPSATLTFKVVEVAYYFYTWQTAQDPSRYASVISGIHGDSIISINRGGAQYLRVKVQMSTANGLEAYYYISVGEIPTLNFTERTDGGVSSQEIQDISVQAGENNGINIGNGKYNLTMSFNSSSSTTDATDLLSFHIVQDETNVHNIWIDYDTMTLYADDTTENYNTQFVFYTKFGALETINIFVLTNYSINLITPNTSNLQYNSNLGIYEIDSGNVININDTFQVVKNDGESTFTTFDDISIRFLNSVDNSVISFAEVDDKDIIKVGLVKQDTNVNILIVFTFNDGAEQVTYNFIMNLRIHAVLDIGLAPNGKQISQMNMWPVNGIVAGEITNLDILLNLFTYSGNVDFNEWYENVTLNNLGRFDIQLITQNVYGLFSGAMSENSPYEIVLNVSEVATTTPLSFRVLYYNTISDSESPVMTSYFNFTLSPNFVIVTNYPTPNASSTVVAESYWFDRTEGANNLISLVDKPDLSDSARVVVQDLNGQSHQNNIVARVNLGAEYVYVNDELVGERYFSLDTEFKISQNSQHSVYDGLSIQFGLYYQIINETTTYVPVGVYNVVVLNNVYEMTGYNFNAPDAINSLNNLENIYIGTDDDILTRINLTFTVPTDAVLTTTKYLKVTQINGINAESSLVTLTEGMQGDEISVLVNLLDLNVADMSAFVSSDAGVQWSVYEIGLDDQLIDSNLTNGQNVPIQSNISVTLESRIQLSYRTVTNFNAQGESATTASQNIEFFKQYGLLSGTDCTLESEDITEERTIQKIIYINSRNGASVADGALVGTYYVDYGFDIEFEQTEVSLTAGQNTSVLHNGTSANSNYLSLLNMKRSSDGSYYTKDDFSADGLNLSIDGDTVTFKATNSDYQNLINSGTSYLRYTQSENEECIYDFNFMAQGSPRETSVTTTLVLTVNYGTISKEFQFTFIVSHDYENETLRNSDGTPNSEVHRNYIRDYNFVSYIEFAVWGSKAPNENFIYIEHKNENQNQDGNVAPMFNVTYDQGNEYISQYPQSSTYYNLSFRFSDIMFGNKNVDIVLTDAYGYTIRYYVTIVAQYNIEFRTSSISAFENDTIGLVDQSSIASNYDHTIFVTFTKRDSGLANYEVADLNNWKATLTYEDSTETQQKLVYDLESINNQFYFDVGFIDTSNFTNGRITGTLTLSATTVDNYNVSVSIPITIRERYSLTSSTTPYVRDGVAFSLLDVIDVVDNSQNFVVGERSITNSYTIYIDFTIKDEKGSIVSLADVANVLSLRIRAHNVQTSEDFYATVPYDSSTKYLSVTDLFGFEDISNYQFRIGYTVTEHEYDSEHTITHSTTTNSDFYYTNSLATQSIYDLSYETDSGYKGSSTLVTFKNSYYNEESGIEFPEDGSDNKPKWPNYTLQVNECYIVEDQTLTIGLRQLDNNSQIKVYFVNQADSTDVRQATLSADKNTVATYSLSELGVIDTSRGEKVTLQTNAEKTIIDGLLVTQWADLKGVQFANSGNDDELSDSYSMRKYIENGAEFLTSTDGLNIEYVQSNLQVDVSYAYENGEAKKQNIDFTAPVWITLKYIDVDSTVAYGSEQQRNAQLPSNYLQSGISIDVWAGTTYRPFELVAGRTTATSFVAGEDTTLSGNVDDLEFAINTTPAGSQYVQIDEDGLITLSEEFDIRTNYILIDIFVKYGANGSAGSRIIDTVRVYFSQLENAELKITANIAQLPRVTSQGQYFTIKARDVLQMLSISDGSNAWSGEEILNVFGVAVGFYSDSSESSDPTQITSWITNPGGMHSLNSLDDTYMIPEGYSLTNVRVDLTRNDVTKYLTLSNIRFVESRYASNSMVSSSSYEYYGTVSASTIFNDLLPSLAVRNIYGNTDRGVQIFDLIDASNYYEELEASHNVIYQTGLSNGIVQNITYTIGENLGSATSVVFGTIAVSVYKDASVISGRKSNLNLSPGQSTTDIINCDNINFTNMPAYGYQTESIQDGDTSTYSQFYVYIDADDLGNINPLNVTDIKIYQNGNEIGSVLISSGQASIRDYSITLDGQGLKLLFVNARSANDIETYNGDIFTFVLNDSLSNISSICSFLFKTELVNSTGNQPTSTYITQYSDIFAVLSDINGINANKIYVHITNGNEYVSLANDSKVYSLMLLNSIDSMSEELVVTVEFYTTIYDFVTASSINIPLYRNVLMINVVN